VADSAGVEQENIRLFPTTKPLENVMPMKDLVLKYPTSQEPYRAAVIETNPKLLKQKISGAQQAAILRFKELENSSDHHAELRALTDALTALKILAETTWAECDKSTTERVSRYERLRRDAQLFGGTSRALAVKT